MAKVRGDRLTGDLLSWEPPKVAAGFGDERWWRRCEAFFICGSVYGSESGADDLRRPNIEKAKSLLAEAGYPAAVAA